MTEHVGFVRAQEEYGVRGRAVMYDVMRSGPCVALLVCPHYSRCLLLFVFDATLWFRPGSEKGLMHISHSWNLSNTEARLGATDQRLTPIKSK